MDAKKTKSFIFFQMFQLKKNYKQPQNQIKNSFFLTDFKAHTNLFIFFFNTPIF